MEIVGAHCLSCCAPIQLAIKDVRIETEGVYIRASVEAITRHTCDRASET